MWVFRKAPLNLNYLKIHGYFRKQIFNLHDLLFSHLLASQKFILPSVALV